jgi:two-component system, chemotaxis family, protein-glutamate methylesterase/glutaminase
VAPAVPQPGPRPRVLVADDSSFMRRLLTGALTERGCDFVGQAVDGDDALAKFKELRPDAMTLDLAMPGRDGIGVLRTLRAGGRSVPVVVVSAFSPSHGARAVDALAEGAFDLVAKPRVGEKFAATLTEKLHAATGSGTAKAAAAAPATAPPAGAVGTTRTGGLRRDTVLVVATSTGGPRALASFVPKLPATLGAGGLVVQHMPEGFTASLADRLNTSARCTVREAAPGDRLRPDQLLIAPGGRHLRVDAGGALRLTEEPPIGALRPRADLTIVDAARHYGSAVTLVVLTGMGADGLDGAKAVRERGGRVLCEAAETCTVYGMPRAVVEAGLADVVLPLDELPGALQ